MGEGRGHGNARICLNRKGNVSPQTRKTDMEKKLLAEVKDMKSESWELLKNSFLEQPRTALFHQLSKADPRRWCPFLELPDSAKEQFEQRRAQLGLVDRDRFKELIEERRGEIKAHLRKRQEVLAARRRRRQQQWAERDGDLDFQEKALRAAVRGRASYAAKARQRSEERRGGRAGEEEEEEAREAMFSSELEYLDLLHSEGGFALPDALLRVKFAVVPALDALRVVTERRPTPLEEKVGTETGR